MLEHLKILRVPSGYDKNITPNNLDLFYGYKSGKKLIKNAFLVNFVKQNKFDEKDPNILGAMGISS